MYAALYISFQLHLLLSFIFSISYQLYNFHPPTQCNKVLPSAETTITMQSRPLWQVENTMIHFIDLP